MDVEIRIPKRLYDDIVQYCKVENTEPEKYCVSALRKQLSLDKYGDLNDKLKKTNDKDEEMVDKIPAKLLADEIIPVIPMNPPDPEVSFMVEIENAKEIVEEEKKEPETEKKKHRTIQTK